MDDVRIQNLTAKVYELQQRQNDAGGGLQWTTYAPLSNLFSQGNDPNGTLDTCAYALTPDGNVQLRGTVITPSTGAVTAVTFGTLPVSSLGPYSMFPVTNAGGGQGGNCYLRNNGNLQFEGNFGNGAIIRVYGRLILN